jgi:hypothetical protein
MTSEHAGIHRTAGLFFGHERIAGVGRAPRGPAARVRPSPWAMGWLEFALILFQAALRPQESERVLECRLDVAAEGDEPFLAARRADQLQRGGQPGRTAGHRQGQGGQAGQVDRQGQHGERYAPLAD